MNRPALLACLATLPALAGFPALAATPAAWEMNNYRDFIAGRLTGLSLTRDGRLALAPRLDTVFDSGQPVVWSAAAAPDGTVYIGTGHRGRVFRIAKSGQAALLWTAEQPEVFALAVDSKGAVYAATSPGGRIYRIEDGKAGEYFAPGSKYIWSLAFGPDGALYAGTGDQGKIFRITAAGKGEVYYETGQSHVTSLAIDALGRLLAGSEPNGILYRVAAKDQAFVLYDATLPEIRALVPAADGTVYAAALGGSVSRRALGGVQSIQGIPGSVSVGGATTTVTVEASETQSGIDIKPKPEAARPQAAQLAAGAVPAMAADTTGVEKSAVYRINPDNTVESLWSSKDENVYDLLVRGPEIVFSTDSQGRIYRMGADRRPCLLAQTNEGEAIRLLATGNGILVATGDVGKLYRLGAEPGPSGTYESPVHDAAAVARWGRLAWRADAPAAAGLAFRTRAGNSARPDKTWSEWSQPLTDAAGSPIQSPNARYVQWQAEFTGLATLESVTLNYLPQNAPPVVRSVTVTAQLSSAAAAKASAAQAQSGGAYTVTVSDTPDAAAAPPAGTPTQPVTRPGAEQLQIAWQADDPDGDRLVYALYFRGEDEREWKLLKSNLSDNTYSIDSDSFADGRYYFRVVASDSPANPPAAARTAELVSAPTLIDRTPPVVTAGVPRRSGGHVEIEFDATDAASPLRRAEYSLDAGPWVLLEPVEGIIDSPHERFLLKLDGLSAGEHLVVVRVLDSANNAGLAKVVLR
jgi:hypothetical protein